MRCRHPAVALAAALFVALAAPVGRAQQPPAEPAVAEAQAHYQAGQKAYEEKQYEQALAEFRASYKAVPSPNSHLYIARCLRALDRIGEAYDEYTQVILESADRLGSEKKYAATQKAASEERAQLPGRAQPPAGAGAVAEAQARFFAGQKAYEDKQYEQALAEFRASYKAVPSPNSRLYVARCLRELNRIPAAYDELGQVIVEAGERALTDKKYEATRKAAEEERAALADRVATLSIAVPADAKGAKVFVGAEEVPEGRWGGDLAVTPGEVKVRVEAPGRAPFERTITVAAGGKQKVAVALPAAGPKPSARPSPVRIASYASAGAGVVGFVVGGALAAKASSRYHDLQMTCGGRCPPSRQGDVDAGRAETTGSKVGVTIGVLGVAAGAGLFAYDVLRRGDKPRTGSLSLEIAPNPLAPSATLRGRF